MAFIRVQKQTDFHHKADFAPSPPLAMSAEETKHTNTNLFTEGNEGNEGLRLNSPSPRSASFTFVSFVLFCE
jgi:hypothetical protein